MAYVHSPARPHRQRRHEKIFKIIFAGLAVLAVVSALALAVVKVDTVHTWFFGVSGPSQQELRLKYAGLYRQPSTGDTLRLGPLGGFDFSDRSSEEIMPDWTVGTTWEDVKGGRPGDVVINIPVETVNSKATGWWWYLLRGKRLYPTGPAPTHMLLKDEVYVLQPKHG